MEKPSQVYTAWLDSLFTDEPRWDLCDEQITFAPNGTELHGLAKLKGIIAQIKETTASFDFKIINVLDGLDGTVFSHLFVNRTHKDGKRSTHDTWGISRTKQIDGRLVLIRLDEVYGPQVEPDAQPAML